MSGSNEGNVMHLQEVLAATLQPHNRQEAEAQLKAYSEEDGYLSALISVFTGEFGNVQPQTQLAAVLAFKNTLSKFVKGLFAARAIEKLQAVSGTNTIPRDAFDQLSGGLDPSFLNNGRLNQITQECDVMKGRLLDLLLSEHEIPKQIQSQLIETVKEFCKSEWPDSWDSLFPRILSCLEIFKDDPVNASQTFLFPRSLLLLHQLLKILHASKMRTASVNIQEIGVNMFPLLFNMYQPVIEALLSALNQVAGEEVDMTQISEEQWNVSFIVSVFVVYLDVVLCSSSSSFLALLCVVVLIYLLPSLSLSFSLSLSLLLPLSLSHFLILSLSLSLQHSFLTTLHHPSSSNTSTSSMQTVYPQP